MDKNSFDEVRLVLALMVVCVHTSTLSQSSDLQWLSLVFDSDFAVKGFFAISGYLVFKSYCSSKSLADYYEKRCRRVFPAYLIVIFFCIGIGAVTTSLSLSDYVTSNSTYQYLLANILMLNFVQPELSGVFQDNPHSAMNGALWTIKIEVLFYLVVPIIYYLMQRLKQSLVLIVIILLSICWFSYFIFISNNIFASQLSRQLPGQLMYFTIGIWLSQIGMSHFFRVFWIVLGCLYMMCKSLIYPGYVEFLNMVIYPLFVISICKTGSFNIGLGKFGDFSYGVYLFHFPVIQLLVHFGVYNFSPYFGFMLGLCITGSLSFLSWHFLEKRILKRSVNHSRSLAS